MASLFLIPACGGGDSDDGLEALADAIESAIENDEEFNSELFEKALLLSQTLEEIPHFLDQRATLMA